MNLAIHYTTQSWFPEIDEIFCFIHTGGIEIEGDKQLFKLVQSNMDVEFSLVCGCVWYILDAIHVADESAILVETSDEQFPMIGIDGSR